MRSRLSVLFALMLLASLLGFGAMTARPAPVAANHSTCGTTAQTPYYSSLRVSVSFAGWSNCGTSAWRTQRAELYFRHCNQPGWTYKMGVQKGNTGTYHNVYGDYYNILHTNTWNACWMTKSILYGSDGTIVVNSSTFVSNKYPST